MFTYLDVMQGIVHLIMYKDRRSNISSIKDIPRTLEKYLWSILICAICTIFPIRFIIHILFHTIAYSVSISNIQYPLSTITYPVHSSHFHPSFHVLYLTYYTPTQDVPNSYSSSYLSHSIFQFHTSYFTFPFSYFISHIQYL